jgi:hypothetical protein
VYGKEIALFGRARSHGSTHNRLRANVAKTDAGCGVAGWNYFGAIADRGNQWRAPISKPIAVNA